MRPPEFTGGNTPSHIAKPALRLKASMRPPEFTGGNAGLHDRMPALLSASMRPPEFTGGNTCSGASGSGVRNVLQ